MEIPDTTKLRCVFTPELKPSRSILKTPGQSDSPRTSASPRVYSPTTRVSFGRVQVLEFEQKAGSGSQGVPEQGAASLYLGALVDCKNEIPVEKFEEERKSKLFERALQRKGVSVDVKDDELYTRGREDILFHSYTHKDRIKKYQMANNGVKVPTEELKKETKELEAIRQSRQRVGCSCKPICQLSAVELRGILAKYGLPTHGNHKTLQDRVKDQVLQSNSPLLARFREPSSSPCYSPQNTFRFGQPLQKWLTKKNNPINVNKPTRNKAQKRAKKLNLLDQCCWDDACECVRSGIRCHDDGPCGCLDKNKPCDNPNGQYIYKEPHYPKQILQEWLQEYNDVPSDNENDNETSHSSSYLRTSSDNEEEKQDKFHNLQESLSIFVLE